VLLDVVERQRRGARRRQRSRGTDLLDVASEGNGLSPHIVVVVVADGRVGPQGRVRGTLLPHYVQLKLEDEQDPNLQHNLGRMLELSVPAPEAARRGGGQAQRSQRERHRPRLRLRLRQGGSTFARRTTSTLACIGPAFFWLGR
jgi:hypothetical protein